MNATASLVDPHIYDFREGLNKALVNFRESAPADSSNKPVARSAVVPCVEALVESFSNRWGSGKNVLTYREGKRCHPQSSGPSS